MSNIVQHFGSPMIEQGVQGITSQFSLGGIAETSIMESYRPSGSPIYFFKEGGKIDEAERERDYKEIQSLKEEYRNCLTRKAMCDASDKFAQSCVYKQKAMDCKKKVNKLISKYREKYGRTESADWLSFANGGKISAQNEVVSEAKEKLNESFVLPIEMAVYVPSTKGANEEISEDEFHSRIEETEKYLSNLFGGYSKVNIDGGYVSETKGLIKEDVAKVVAFSQDADFINNKLPRLIKRIVLWCDEWTQESIGFELEGDLFYVDKDFKYEKFAHGGEIATFYNVVDEDGDILLSGANESRLIEYANTIFYYDINDSGESDIHTLEDAMDAYDSLGYSVEEAKVKRFAKGGLYEHGLKVNDTIKAGGSIGKTTIRVNNSNSGDFRVDLDSGERTELVFDKKTKKYIEKKADGGSIDKLLDVKHKIVDYRNKNLSKVGNKISPKFTKKAIAFDKKADSYTESMGKAYLEARGIKADGGEFGGGGWVSKSEGWSIAEDFTKPTKNYFLYNQYTGARKGSFSTKKEAKEKMQMLGYYADGGSVDIVKKDRYGNKVKIGDAIHIRVLTGRYGETKDYEGIITNFDQFGNVELDGQRSVRYTADYKHNDYEHGHHIWVEKINEKDIKENLRVPKKFVPTFSSRNKVYGEDVKFKGTEIEFKEFLKNKYPNSVWGQWNPLYNKGWRYKKGKYISPDNQEYDGFDFYQSVEQGQGHLNTLLIPKTYADGGEFGNSVKSHILTPEQKDYLELLLAIEKDGFNYAIVYFSDYKGIKNPQFVSARNQYKESVKDLENYIEKVSPDDTAFALEKEGIEYGFLEKRGYSDWKTVKDAKFHALLAKAKASYEKLKSFITKKFGISDLNDDSIYVAINKIDPNRVLKRGGMVSKNLKRIVRKGTKYGKLAIKKAKPKAKKIIRKAKIGFDALAKRVAKSYEGKAVAPKYQKEYGKRYSKEEAQEVGNKVAAKVKRMKGM